MISLLGVVAHASEVYDEQDRELHSFFGGSRLDHGHGGSYFRPEPTVALTCSGDTIQTCTPHSHHYGTIVVDGGIRVCTQYDPEDSTSSETKCMVPTADNVVMVFSENDTCGCCNEEGDGTCPSACSTCGCTGTTMNGVEYDGFYMNTTHHHHRYGGESTDSACVPVDDTVDAQLRGDQCVEEGSCPTACSTCSCTGTSRYGVDYDGNYTTMTDRHHWYESESTYTTCVPVDDTVGAQLSGGECIDEASCPTGCSTCNCTGTSNGGTYEGFYMTMTRRSRWYGGEYTCKTCVPAEYTIDARLRGGECVVEPCDA